MYGLATHPIQTVSVSQKIALNTLVQLIGKAISTGSSLVITFFIGRYLGEVFYGNFTKVFTTTTLLFMVLDFGFNAVVVKRINHRPQSLSQEFNSLFSLRLLIAFLLYCLLILFLLISPTPKTQGYSLVVKLSIAVFALQYFTQATFISCNAIFQYRLEYFRSVVAASTGNLIQMFITVALVLNHASLELVSLAHLIGSISMGVVSLFLLRPLVSKISISFPVKQLTTLLKHTSPIGFALVLNLFATHTDTILLTLLSPTPQVAFYGLARRVFDVVLVFPTFFMNATYPILINAFKKSSANFKRLFLKSLTMLLLTSLVLGLSLFFFSPLLTYIRQSFYPAITALKILSLFTPIFFVSSLLMWTIIVLNQEKLLVRIYAFAVVVNITLNIVFIPKLGFIAPAITAGITEVCILALFTLPVIRFVRRYYAKK